MKLVLRASQHSRERPTRIQAFQNAAIQLAADNVVLAELQAVRYGVLQHGVQACAKPRFPAKPKKMIRPLCSRCQCTYTRGGYVGGPIIFSRTMHSSAPAVGSPEPGLLTRSTAGEGTGDITQRRVMPVYEAYHKLREQAHLLIEHAGGGLIRLAPW